MEKGLLRPNLLSFCVICCVFVVLFVVSISCMPNSIYDPNVVTSDLFLLLFTCSMMGVPEDPGIIPRFAEDLFKRIESFSRQNTPSLHVSSVHVQSCFHVIL